MICSLCSQPIRILLGLAIMWNMVQTDHDEIEKAEAMNSMAAVKYTIDHTWDGLPLAHEPVKVGESVKNDYFHRFFFQIELKWHFERLVGRPHKRVVKISFDAPFFDDPEPMDAPGITPQLWEFEVLEFFFANDRGQYLEVEIGPHGHWLCLLFDGVRHTINNGENLKNFWVFIEKFCSGEELELEVRNKWVGDRWVGEVEIPLAYFPASMFFRWFSWESWISLQKSPDSTPTTFTETTANVSTPPWAQSPMEPSRLVFSLESFGLDEFLEFWSENRGRHSVAYFSSVSTFQSNWVTLCAVNYHPRIFHFFSRRGAHRANGSFDWLKPWKVETFLIDGFFL